MTFERRHLMPETASRLRLPGAQGFQKLAFQPRLTPPLGPARNDGGQTPKTCHRALTNLDEVIPTTAPRKTSLNATVKEVRLSVAQ